MSDTNLMQSAVAAQTHLESLGLADSSENLSGVGYEAAGHNCNCGDRLMEFNGGSAGTVAKCARECTRISGCVSFGLWDTTSPMPGFCALFDTACTDVCPRPTSTNRGYTNMVFNKKDGDVPLCMGCGYDG